jgi:perosamine synthetase
MWVRTQLKISWSDLLISYLKGFSHLNREVEQKTAERFFSPAGDAVTAYSVRSGFDLVLQALNLKPGDEVIFSALNVRAMIKVVNNLGLVPVPVDIDLSTMEPRLDKLQQAITPRSRVFVAAHLFGTRLELGPTFQLAKSKGLTVIEDCAQAFNGKEYMGSPLADVVMYSFGPIKTATALGGAVLRVNDGNLLTGMRAIQSCYPIQSDVKQRQRVLKFFALKAATNPFVLGMIYKYYRMKGQNYEDSLADRVRDVAPLKTVENMRLQPSALMLWMINRRLNSYAPSVLADRSRKGELLTRLINAATNLPGQASKHHDYWVYPVLVREPKRLIEAMREEGFDVADLPRSQHIAAPADRPELEPSAAASLMREIVILPCYASMPDSEIERQARVLRAALAAQN